MALGRVFTCPCGKSYRAVMDEREGRPCRVWVDEGA